MPTPSRKHRRRRPWLVSAEGFRELRLSCLLSRRTAAAFLGVSVDTVRRWDRGRQRVPWAVVRLLRLKRLGDLGALAPAWDGWRLDGDAIWSPEGFVFRVGEVGWWGLLIAQARAFRERYDREARGVGAPAPARPQAVTLCPCTGTQRMAGPASEPAPAERGDPSPPNRSCTLPDLAQARFPAECRACAARSDLAGLDLSRDTPPLPIPPEAVAGEVPAANRGPTNLNDVRLTSLCSQSTMSPHQTNCGGRHG